MTLFLSTCQKNFNTKTTLTFHSNFHLIWLGDTDHVQAPGIDGVLVEWIQEGGSHGPKWNGQTATIWEKWFHSHRKPTHRWIHIIPHEDDSSDKLFKGQYYIQYSNPLTGEEKQTSIILANECLIYHGLVVSLDTYRENWDHEC